MRNPYNLSKPDNPFRPIADSSNGNSLLTDTISSEKYVMIKKLILFQFDAQILYDSIFSVTNKVFIQR